MNKKTVSVVLPALSLSLLLAACDGSSSPGPVDTSTKITSLSDSGAGSLRQAIAEAKAGDTLKFTTSGNVTLDSPIITDKNLTIEAEGVILDAAGKGRVLEVPAGVTVTIKGGTLTGGVGKVLSASMSTAAITAITSAGAPSMAGTPARLTAQADPPSTYGGIVLNSGNLTLDGTTVSGGKADIGAGIANNSTGTLTITGTTNITGNTASINGAGIANSGKIILTDGSISGNTSYYGGAGIHGGIGSTLSMSGGNIDNNTCTYPVTVKDNQTSGCAGGGIYSNGDVTISSGSVSGNKVSYFGGGVTVQVTTDANKNPVIPKLTISGGTFENNKVTDETRGSAGGIWSSGPLTLTGGIVKGNTAPYGGGLGLYGEATVTGGTIQGNTAKVSGGGIEAFTSSTATTIRTLNLGGSASVIGNTASDNSGGIAVSRSKLVMAGGTVSNNTAVNTGGGLVIGGGSSSVIQGGVISGNKVTGEADGGGGVRVHSTATLSISGGEISGNTAIRNGGGVTIGGKVTMTGGSITGNTVTGTDTTKGQGRGGGVHMYSNATFTASGGSVSGNTAALQGGGVWMGGSFVDDKGVTVPASKFTLSGAKIENNKVTTGSGGAVYVGGIFDMTSGSISGNTASGTESGQGRGGGVRIGNTGTFTASGGTIASNTAEVQGGGIYVNNSYVDDKGVTIPGGTLNLAGATITGNKATTGSGGGVANGGTFTLQSGSVTTNTSANKGGGVRNFKGATFAQSGGEVTGNTPDQIVTDQ
ncbi:beta strand repeat-containing protein [Deinococcus antarcticus]|uniref:Beta strand repeat-containing protein n=1 Tax=Deinococcus antarcticus TaxID=1298767 RepID=A0ABV8A8Y5_9DEIO